MYSPLPNTRPTRKAKLDRHSLHRVINDLIRRRQQHEARINKLLHPNYHLQDATKSSPRAAYQEFSEVLRKLDGEEAQSLHDSIGGLGLGLGLGHHVNLLATVSLKTDYHLVEKQHLTEQGQLYPSLIERYGKKTIKYEFDDGQQPEAAPEWLQRLVRYLIAEEMVNGLFLLEGGKGRYDFSGTRFQHGKYEEILLSKEPIEEAERGLVVVSEKEGVNISWLLLARLLKPLEGLNFTLAVHRLFSFPYKKFAIGQSLQLINLMQLMARPQPHQEESNKFYGIDHNGSSNKLTPPTPNSLTNYKPLVQRYSSILVMNQTEFPVKSLPLSCLRNHFVVVTLILKAEGNYYITVGGESQKMRFKLCLLDFQGRLIQSETVSSGQFMLAAGLREEEYELYVSPQGGVEKEILGQEESFQLVKESQEQFWLWVQGSAVSSRHGDLQMEIHLKEQYNVYTLKIAQEYIKQHQGTPASSSPQGTTVQEGGIIVKRFFLSGVELVLDQLCSPLQRRISIKYAQANLCDGLFQDTIATLTTNDPSKDSLVLRKPTHIESIHSAQGGQGSQGNSPISFKVFTYFL